MPGGPRWDVVEHRESIEVQNLLETFAAFNLDVRQPLSQTIIRIPLRTAAQAEASKISQRHSGIPGIKRALEQFSLEIQDGGLLFLKHIRKVTIRIDSESVLEAETIKTTEKDMEYVP